MKTKKLIAMFMIALFFFGCKKDSTDEISSITSTPDPDSKISGVVYSPTGTPIGSAKVSAGPFSTITNNNGEFTLEVLHGNYTLIITSGSGKLFRTELNVTTTAGQDLVITPTQSVLAQTGLMAHIPGMFDAIEDVITSLGYNSVAITVADLSNSTMLASYDALFLNCGSLGGNTHLDSTKYMNLLSFLENGGSIYASDFAVDFLHGDGYWRTSGPITDHNHTARNANTSSTCTTPNFGGFINDTSLCTSNTGPMGLLTGVTVVDPDLINALGTNTIDINYDLGSWDKINIYDTPFYPLITDAVNGTLAVRSSYFGENGGRIIYTTFHNEPQGSVSADVATILNYYIINL